MTQQTLIPVAETQIATVPQPVPSVESMLQLAIEKGIDPNGLEKLVMLHERMEAKRAEHAFVDAMREFRKVCPPLTKNRTATNQKTGKDMYDFLDLPGLQRAIDPLLAEHGFSYRWDADVTANGITTICILSHREGHRETSTFSCQATGTEIMSQPQKAASATTFGRRYSLLGVLGLSAENDDDGANATPPERPNQRENPATAQPRADRVTAEELKTLFDLFKTVMSKAKKHHDLGALGTWVQATVGIEPEYCRSVTHWTREKLEKAFCELESLHV